MIKINRWLFVLGATFFISSQGHSVINGHDALEGEWPWMSSLAFENRHSNYTAELIFEAESVFVQSLRGSASAEVSADFFDCGLAESTCVGASEKICLIEESDPTLFDTKARSCEQGGGVGLVFIVRSSSITIGTDFEFSSAIPAVYTFAHVGDQFLARLSTVAQLNTVEERSTYLSRFCGGTFIGHKWVLTAAHCLDGIRVSNEDDFRVQIGVFENSDTAELLAVARGYTHPEFEPNLRYDIALIELAQPQLLPSVSSADNELAQSVIDEGATAVLIGMGCVGSELSSDREQFVAPEVLQQAELAVSTSVYQPVPGSAYSGDILAGSADPGEVKGICPGDSGGPLVVLRDNHWQQIGVVSRDAGGGFGGPGFNSVFAKVPDYQDWIESITENLVIQGSSDFDNIIIGTEQESVVYVGNNSQESAHVSIQVIGSPAFQIDDSACDRLDTDEGCELSVLFTPEELGEFRTTITVVSDDPNLAQPSVVLEGSSLQQELEFSRFTGIFSENVEWFSGGDASWTESSDAKGDIESGSILGGEESVLLAQISGPGTLSFEGELDGHAPGLHVYRNGELLSYIEHETAIGAIRFSTFQIELSEDANTIMWHMSTAGAKAYLKNFSFQPYELLGDQLPRVTEIDPEPIAQQSSSQPASSTSSATSSTAGSSSSGGGGSSGLWLILLLAVLERRAGK
jgi:secreted trypsin-like serine protease/uncharacterized membrane protein YgcG